MAWIIGCGFSSGFEDAHGVSMLKASMKPQEIQRVHTMLKDKIEHARNPKEKGFLEKSLLKFEKYYISPDDYILEYSIQGPKGEAKSFTIIATTDENKRFSKEYPCEAKDTFKDEKLYVQPKLDLNKEGDLVLKVSVVLGREEFMLELPYKKDAEVFKEHKSAKGPLKSHAKLKIKKGFFGV